MRNSTRFKRAFSVLYRLSPTETLLVYVPSVRIMPGQGYPKTGTNHQVNNNKKADSS
ncbi:MAG: hypothetical protein LBF22_15030 [Deltaproteobacteria bacterium]|nr:hypothetical protein [Deltaproteobacteria bacterium]